MAIIGFTAMGLGIGLYANSVEDHNDWRFCLATTLIGFGLGCFFQWGFQ